MRLLIFIVGVSVGGHARFIEHGTLASKIVKHLIGILLCRLNHMNHDLLVLGS